jgi:VanZ family protein
MKAPKFVRYWMPVIIWMTLIFIGSTDVLSAEHTSRFLVPFLRWLDPQISWATVNSIQIVIRKLGHLTEYAILATLIWHALRSAESWKRSIRILFTTSLIACAVFAASDEFHQSFVASRTSSMNDVIIDICGAAIALAICVALASRNVLKQKRV